MVTTAQKEKNPELAKEGFMPRSVKITKEFLVSSETVISVTPAYFVLKYGYLKVNQYF